MSDTLRVRPVGDLPLLRPLLRPLEDLGAVVSPLAPTHLVLVGATSVAEASELLIDLSPRLRPRAVLVGLGDHLDLAAIPGSLTELLARMQVLGSLPAATRTSHTIQSFIGACGHHGELAQLVGARYFRFGPASHKVWTDLPAISVAAFLLRLVEAVEAAGTWFDVPPTVRYAPF